MGSLDSMGHFIRRRTFICAVDSCVWMGVAELGLSIWAASEPLRQLNPFNGLVQAQRILVGHAGHEIGEQ